jgi:hypothetical protein
MTYRMVSLDTAGDEPAYDRELDRIMRETPTPHDLRSVEGCCLSYCMEPYNGSVTCDNPDCVAC